MRSRVILIALALAACGPASKPEVATVPIGPVTAKTPVPKGPREGICPATATLVRSFRSPVHLTAYISPTHPRLVTLRRALDELFERLVKASPSVVASVIDTTTTEGARERAHELGLAEMDLYPDGDEDKPAYAKAFSGIALTYGSEADKISLVDPEHLGGLEFAVAMKLREIRDRGDALKHTIGVVAGHGEIALSEPNLVPSSTGQKPSIAQIMAQYFPFHRLVDVDLGAAIDPKVDGLLVLQPERDLSDRELRAIDHFAMKGKPLAIAVSAVNIARGDTTMHATLSRHGVERLTSGYGIEIANDSVVDFDHSFKVAVATSTGPKNLVIPAFVNVDQGRLDPRVSMFFRLQTLAFPFPSSIAIHPDKQPGADVRVVARTTDRAMADAKGPLDLGPMRQWRPKGPFGEIPIAAIATGPLRSAFDPAVTSSKPGRVLVLASSQLFANPLARANGSVADAQMGLMMPHGDEILDQLAMPYAQTTITTTILAAKGLLDWLAYDDGLAECALQP